MADENDGFNELGLSDFVTGHRANLPVRRLTILKNAVGTGASRQRNMAEDRCNFNLSY